MSYINVGKENPNDINIYYEDQGAGKPVVLIHGWPLSGLSWEKQVAALLGAGYRVITYDRRGFGQSDKPTTGYDYDTFADDLHKLMTELDLYGVALVGFSMGGGEVARYFGKYGRERVNKAVFISAVPPFLLKTLDNPEGVAGKIFDGIKKAIVADRQTFLSQFLSDFYNFNILGGKLVSKQVIKSNLKVATNASVKGTVDCVSAWLTDFRKDLARIDVPTLVIQGDADRILPIAATGKRLPTFVKGSKLVVIEGGPHGITWTHAEQVNRELLGFLAEGKQEQKSQESPSLMHAR
jgi:pimeloyl-ACP methyl ester carboxylesterase